MDYSLLLGIHYKSRSRELGMRRRSVQLSADALWENAIALRALRKMHKNGKLDSVNETASSGGSSSGSSSDSGGESNAGSSSRQSRGGRASMMSSSRRGGARTAAVARNSSRLDVQGRRDGNRRSGGGRGAGGRGTGGRARIIGGRQVRNSPGVGPGGKGVGLRAVASAHAVVPKARRRRGNDIFTHADDLTIRGSTADGEYCDEVYHMGIIDILQQYDTKKGVETLFKSLLYKKDTISSVNPKQYGERFIKFMADITAAD